MKTKTVTLEIRRLINFQTIKKTADFMHASRAFDIKGRSRDLVDCVPQRVQKLDAAPRGKPRASKTTPVMGVVCRRQEHQIFRSSDQ